MVLRCALLQLQSSAFRRYATVSTSHRITALYPTRYRARQQHFSTGLSSGTSATGGFPSPSPVSDEHSLSVASMTIAFDRALLERRTEDAVFAVDGLRRKGSFPSRDSLSTLISQLAYKQTPLSLSQADRLIQDLVASRREDLLDQNSLSLLALAYAGVGMANFSRSTLRLMFQTGLYPPVRVWTAVVSKIAESFSEAPAALELFKEICKLTGGTVDASSREPCKMVEEPDPVARIIKLMDFAMMPKGNEELLVSMRPDVTSFNSALRICATLADTQNAEEIFHSMSLFGVLPNSDSFELLIKVYGKARRFDLFRKVPQRMEAACVRPSASTLKALIDAYVESGNIEEAEKVLQKTVQGKSSLWNLVKLEGDVYNSLLKAYALEARLSDAANLLSSVPLEDAGTGLDQARVVASMIASGMLKEICSILQYMLQHRMEVSFSAYKSLMHGFCANNQLDKAASFIILMKRAGIKPDCSIYGPLIQGLVRCRDRLLAYHTFLEMVEARIVPDEATYVSLLKALTVEERASKMVRVLEAVMEFPSVKISLFSWNLVIEYCSKKKLIGDAQRMLARMAPAGVQPDSYSYWYVVKGLITRSRLTDVLGLWPQIQFASRRDRPNRIILHKQLVETLMYAFVKGANFAQALELLEYAKEEDIPLDREAFKDLFLKYHSHRFTSKHKSPLRVYGRQQQLLEMEEFKKWLSLGAVKTPARYAKILKYGPFKRDEGPFF
ncbi:pentatricopeptide repeat-containing protein At3g09650, chloroplastic isoform X1 [Selaginella moellendorffii]|uniref:pentatricopeptide repeat-containing protein At3g09650, chloroplastic isoform X1 n=2 Tax=Selaginella moellendorffii TaxID=88036 RepID=UPI000D1CAA84|nr:pentatricopeptide repeat-containing protein At3g09650, chloroplastic isoform X1 [Selaginella moellendorffii]|eukprot:XP_024541507.1 pentatricopeptide repeat-containing protein At3g09650, chloroplastic isoform X1 [Selaginella moellendorffii]